MRRASHPLAINAAKAANKARADARGKRAVRLCEALRKRGLFTYREQADELNRLGERRVRGGLWTAQSLYICCRRGGARRQKSREVHELVDGRWRDTLRAKVLELKSCGVTRYDDLAEALNKEGVTTRLGQPWSKLSVYRLLRDIGLQAGRPGRRRRDE